MTARLSHSKAAEYPIVTSVLGGLSGGVYGRGIVGLGRGFDAIQATKNAEGPDGGRLKLSLCRNFRSGLGCSYGDRCGFAHGEAELERHRAHAANLGLPQTASAAATLTMDPSTTSVVKVPSHQLGMILGRGGARIKEMRTQSGAKIQVEDKAVEPQRQLRNVMISGSIEQRQWAAYLIAMAIQGVEARSTNNLLEVGISLQVGFSTSPCLFFIHLPFLLRSVTTSKANLARLCQSR